MQKCIRISAFFYEKNVNFLYMFHIYYITKHKRHKMNKKGSKQVSNNSPL